MAQTLSQPGTPGANFETGARVIGAAVVVASLGYFVDIYDLVLITVVRQNSLADLGVKGAALLSAGSQVLGKQMWGMLLGGLLWGVLGDRKGRLSVLFGSIFLYSLANIANGMVHTVEAYGWCRLIAGVGLAGELGAGITLVNEIMHRDKRGYGTMTVVTVGVLGAILAALVGENYAWRTSYFIGGGLGLALLVLRFGVHESGMFRAIEVREDVVRGNFFSLFSQSKRARKYIGSILIGVPIWYVIALLGAFAPELAKSAGMKPLPIAGTVILYLYVGLAIGDFLAGYISQIIRNRKKVIFGFLVLTSLAVAGYFLLISTMSQGTFYLYVLLLGICSGYWALFVTVGSEQFGTNIRATVTTTVPNFVRGAVPTLLFLRVVGMQALTHRGVTGAILGSTAAVGALTLIVAFIAWTQLDETFGKDLDFMEEISI